MPLWSESSPESAHETTAAQRDRFSPEELAIVLSHYPLGEVQVTEEFARGSRRSPKVVITTNQGKFLVKRRASGKNDRQRVVFSHAIQLHLSHKHFPLPRLVATKTHQSFLQLESQMYEVFEFLPSTSYPGTLEATEYAGRTLAIYHQLLMDFPSTNYHPPSSYHRSATVQQSFARIETAAQVPREVLTDLRKLYTAAADHADRSGMPDWPPHIIHADWHPGNLLFKEDQVIAVLDYDAARRLPLVIDLANGALQFSMIVGSENAGKWPPEADESRLRKFLHGYRAAAPISPAESLAIPWLMLEALIAEAVFPIAVNGMFGRIHGDVFLHMLQRKANWIAHHAPHLAKIAEGA